MNNLFPGGSKYAGLHALDFDLKEGDKVLDVGGGHKPFVKATHVCDFLDHEEQRHGQRLNIGNREFLEGDVCKVLEKFPDKYFDFIFTNHTLEHIKGLPMALNLFSQKGRRGFNAFPGSDFEFFTAQSHYGHVNLIRLINNELHITERPPNTIINEFGKIYERLFQNPEFNQLWEEKYRFIWECRHYWKNSIKYKYYPKGSFLYPQLEFFNEFAKNM